MATWKIVLISIAVVLVVAAIIAITVILVLKNKKKKKNQPVSKPTDKKEPVTIQLHAVKLLKGTGTFGYETEEELKTRLSKLSKKEFEALNIIEFPYNEEQWNTLQDRPEDIEKRNAYEMGIFFAYDYKAKLKPNADIICRTF